MRLVDSIEHVEVGAKSLIKSHLGEDVPHRVIDLSL